MRGLGSNPMLLLRIAVVDMRDRSIAIVRFTRGKKRQANARTKCSD